MNPLPRYTSAHYNWFAEAYPSAFKDHGCPDVVRPDTRTANGLTRFIINFLTWSGHRATRVSSAGRIVDAPQKQQSGISLMTKKYIPGQTRRGTADISATVRGMSVQWEVKTGRDKPSDHQLREQAIEIKAGGKYFFVHTPEEFFEQYDSLSS